MLRINLSLFAIAFLIPVGCGSEAPAGLNGTHPLFAEDDSTLISVSGAASLKIIPGDPSQLEAVSFLSIVPERIRVEAGETISVNAYAYGPFGLPLEGLDYSWELVDQGAGQIASDGPDGATVELTAGDVIATFAGAIRVTATQVIDDLSYQISRDISVVVAVPEADAVLSSVESATGDILAITGGLVRLRAVAYDPLGRIVSEARIEWVLTDPSIGEMIGGDVLNVKAGRGSYPDALILRASLNGHMIETPIALNVTSEAESMTRVSAYIVPSRVTLEPGDSFQFYSTVIDGTGRQIDTTDEQWTLTTSDAGEVDQQGKFSGAASAGSFPDTLVYTAVIDGETIEARASVTLHASVGKHLSTATIRPATVVVARGQPVIFVLLAQDEMDSPVPNLVYQWEVLNPSIGSINDSGFFIPNGSPGIYESVIKGTATETRDGVTVEREAFADLTIVGNLAKVEVIPGFVEVHAGGYIGLKARVLDSLGQEIPGMSVSWSLDDETIGTIDGLGVLHAGSTPGEYENVIVATAEQRALTRE